jgi:hypothetical protein
MNKFLWSSLLITPLIIASQWVGTQAASADEVKDSESNVLQQLDRYSSEGNNGRPSLNQVNNVSQLRDVSPGDWAFEALRNLVERYGCIAGYPDSTYRGSKPLTRYEFAAGLNACLQQIERLIAAGASRGDIETLQKLAEEFKAELATLGTRVDKLEERVGFLEDHQFSTTTKLQGEVVFGISDVFAGEGFLANGNKVKAGDDNNTVFQDRVRLDFVSSFTGKDALHTRLAASNAGAFNDVDQGVFTFQTGPDNGNDVIVDWLAYYFPLGDKVQVYLPVTGPLWQDFVPTVSPYFDSFTGATGSITSFGESNPIYKIGLNGAGIGVNVTPFKAVTVSAGYFGKDASNPSDGAGLFNGEYAALGQVTLSLLDDKLQLALTYSNSYQNDGNIFDLGVGTARARSPFGDSPNSVNSYGAAAAFKLSRFSINAFGGFTDVDNLGAGKGDAEIWYYGLGVAVPDLGKEGNLLGIVAGAEPYVAGCNKCSSVYAGQPKADDVAIHVEAFYKYQLNDNISITPGVVWIGAPFGEGSEADDVIMGTLRTTFTF